VRSALRR